MTYQLPAPPASGTAVDGHGITWRTDGNGLWDPDPCPTCSTRLSGGLSWAQLLDQRGLLNDPAVTP